MFFKGWGVKDFLVFMVIVTLCVLVAKMIGDRIPMIGKVTSRI